MLGNFDAFVIFKINFFKKIHLGTLSEWQTVLHPVQTQNFVRSDVCKGYQQMIKVAASKERVKGGIDQFHFLIKQCLRHKKLCGTCSYFIVFLRS